MVRKRKVSTIETIWLHSTHNVVLSESATDPDVYNAQFVICDFSVNGNGVALDREHIAEWIDTLKNKPLVGKIKVKADGTEDFTGHNAKIVVCTDEDGNQYKELEFDTDIFGTFTDVSVSEVDGVECIVAKAVVYKRCKRACAVMLSRIAEGKLSTSWEIAVCKKKKATIDGVIAMVIEVGRFLGHCLLGKDVQPAYENSGAVSMASLECGEMDEELAQALAEDFIELSATNPPVEPQADPPAEPVIAALTERDLYEAVAKACRDWFRAQSNCRDGYIAWLFPEDHVAWVKEWGCDKTELDITRFEYAVEEGTDAVTVSEPTFHKLVLSPPLMEDEIIKLRAEVEEKNSALATANASIQELQPYKEKFDQAEAERIKAEREAEIQKLREYVVRSGQFTEAELEDGSDVDKLIQNVDTAAVKAIIADRLVASLDKPQSPPDGSTTPTVVVASKNKKVAIRNNGPLEDPDEGSKITVAAARAVISSYIGR